MTHSEVARQIGVSPGTLRRWVRDGLIPLSDGWTPALVAHARIVARLRERGHTLDEIRDASETGRLAYGYMEQLFPSPTEKVSLEEAAERTGLEEALIERLWTSLGFSKTTVEAISEEDLQLLRYFAAILAAGFPLVALLQLARVYGQALGQIADTEVRLFHLYVHEPMMREGVPGLEMAEEMEGLASQTLPLASPIMDHLHQRFVAHALEQDVVGHMEMEAGADGNLGRVKVTIGFADLAGYTRLTEEEGEETALDMVERFVENVENTLPDDARIVKTIGDGVMVVGGDASALVDWAVGFQVLHPDRPRPRIGLHAGPALFRDGDYYGSAVNLASRVAARAAGGEVLVTRPLVAAAGRHLDFEAIGQVRLKGFTETTELYLAHAQEAE
jgi:adenylate cyclase